MTIMPERTEEPELADVVYWLRQRIEQLEETVMHIHMDLDAMREGAQHEQGE